VIRFLIIGGSTLCVLALVFYLFIWHAQPHAAEVGITSVPATPTPVDPHTSAQGFGPGHRPWMKSFDEKGKLVSQFTATEFTPTPTGSFKVDHPISEFFLEKGQVMRVTGDKGEVYCDTAGSGTSRGILSAPTTSPRTGWLHGVHIDLLPSVDATRPIQWMDADNIHFDNDHLRMWTESYTDDHGNIIASDQVPVTIRGDQYEFNGKGMTLIWNGVTRRLEELQILHGDHLVIKDPSMISLPGMTAPPAKTNATSDNHQFSDGPQGHASGRLSPQSTALRTVAKQDTVILVADHPPVKSARPADPPMPYVAVFHDQVRINEGARTMAVADQMIVDFLQSSSSSKPDAGTPAPPAAAASAGSSPSPLPSTASASAAPTQESGNTPTSNTPAANTSAANTSAANTSAAKPAAEPVTIYWTGPLLVTPLRDQTLMPLTAGQSIVKLIGTPVKLTPEGSEVTAAAATYRSPDGAAIVESSPMFPTITLTQVKGLTLSTQHIDYNPATSLAVLSGPSALHTPVGTKAMDVTWSNTGLLHIVRLPGQPNGVDHVDLSDDVAVHHPDFELTTRQLLLDLDILPKPKSSKSDSTSSTGSESDEQLKMLTAIDSVRCRLLQTGKAGDTGINSDRLVIKTRRNTDGTTFPREVEAKGDVNAFDPEQSITAQNLDAMLLPTAKPPAPQTSATKPTDGAMAAVQLDSMHAWTTVHAKLKNGSTADTDDLSVTGPEDARIVLLKNEQGSLLTDGKKSTLESNFPIEIDAANGGLTVHGAGVMKTVRSKATTQPAPQPAEAVAEQPMEVHWHDDMELDSKANVADLHGAVKVINHDLDGTTDTITGDNCHLDLMDAKKTKADPAVVNTAPLDTAHNIKPSKPQPTQDPVAGMGGKDLKQLTLTGHVIGYTLLNAPDGSVLRQGEMHGEKMIYTAIDQTAVIPGKGTMFIENHKPDSNTKNTSGSNRGSMAIQWNKQLTYSQATQIIKIDGNTVTGFEQEPNTGKPKKPQQKPRAPMQLYAEHLVITLGKAPSDPDALLPDGTPVSQNKMQLTDLQAFEQVRFMAPAIDLSCGSIDFNPLKSLITAKGTAREPGETRNAAQTATGTFDELEYDTLNEEVVHVTGSKVQMKH
jgi:hypothetical protein